MTSSPAVELRSVTKRYGRQAAVAEVSFDVGPGERLALLGHNGAGKTTLMKLMLGLTRPSDGAIHALGHEPGGGVTRRAIGFLPENVAFYDAMTGWEVLRFYARLKGRPAAECAALLERVGLTEAAHRRVATYSKGMRQRLGLAQALLGSPRLLLLDEPTTGLDPDLRRRFYEIIRDLKEQGAAVILSSHILTELEARTDRVAIMNHGRLVALGTLDALREHVGLPVRFRLSVRKDAAPAVAERLNGAAVIERAKGASIVLTCRPANKMAVLRAVTSLDGLVSDVDIEPPTLGDVYAHFTGGQAEISREERP